MNTRAEAMTGTACRMPWEDPATAFRSASTFIPPEIAAKKAAAAIAEAQALTDQAQVAAQPPLLLAACTDFTRLS